MAANGSSEAQSDPDVQAARSSDRAAFERLVARFQTDVFTLLPALHRRFRHRR